MRALMAGDVACLAKRLPEVTKLSRKDYRISGKAELRLYAIQIGRICSPWYMHATRISGFLDRLEFLALCNSGTLTGPNSRSVPHLLGDCAMRAYLC